MDSQTHDLAVLKAQAKIRLEELKAQDSAKEVAGKAIGSKVTVKKGADIVTAKG